MSGLDPNVSLKARNDLLWIVDHWTQLRAQLNPGGGNALTGIPGGTDGGQVPIDVHVSDLMAEIEWNVARHYGRILLDEAPLVHGCDNACYLEKPPTPVEKCPVPIPTVTTSRMPGLLRDVATRYGHFTAGNGPLGLAFCDDAHDYRERVRKVLERPAPPIYVGPCQHKGERGDGCVGELYVREGADGGKCRECGTAFTLMEQRTWLDEQMADRLMTASEIGRALKILGYQIASSTVRKWIERKRLVVVIETDGLYRLADAKMLAERAAA